jgi:hypothetical protein
MKIFHYGIWYPLECLCVPKKEGWYLVDLELKKAILLGTLRECKKFIEDGMKYPYANVIERKMNEVQVCKVHVFGDNLGSLLSKNLITR